MRPVRRLLTVLAWGVILAPAAGPAVPVEAGEPADVSTVAADSVAAIRGTEAPLPRHASALRLAGRGLLLPPYAAMRVATWPLVKLAEAEDRAHFVTGLLDLLRFGYARGPVSSTLFFGYESSVGLSLVGLDAEADDWPQAGARLRLGGGYLSDDRNLASLSWSSPPRRVQWQGTALFESRAQRLFHGLGPLSAEDHFEADRRRALGEVTVGVHPGGPLHAAVTGYVRHDALRAGDEGEDDEDFVGTEFPELFATAERSDYAGAEAEIRVDTQPPDTFSPRGTMLRVLGGTDHANSSGDADYRHWLAEAQTRFAVWRGTRTLALRMLAEGVVSDEPERIPYTELVRFGGRNTLRGYGRDRFTDRTGVLLTAEYEYPITARMVGDLFADWGTVAARFDELRLADVDPSVGLGLAFVVGTHGFRAHLARGSEGLEFAIGTETVFDSKSRRLR